MNVILHKVENTHYLFSVSIVGPEFATVERQFDDTITIWLYTWNTKRAQWETVGYVHVLRGTVWVERDGYVRKEEEVEHAD